MDDKRVLFWVPIFTETKVIAEKTERMMGLVFSHRTKAGFPDLVQTQSGPATWLGFPAVWAWALKLLVARMTNCSEVYALNSSIKKLDINITLIQ